MRYRPFNGPLFLQTDTELEILIHEFKKYNITNKDDTVYKLLNVLRAYSKKESERFRSNYNVPAIFYPLNNSINHQGVVSSINLDELKKQYKSKINESKGIEMFVSQHDYPEYFL